MASSKMLAASITVLLLAAGCSGNADDDTKETANDDEASVSSSSPAPPPTATVTQTVEAEPICEPPDAFGTRLLAERWAIVVASKGASDHGKYVTGFSDDVEELVADLEDGGCSESEAFAVSTELSFEAKLLAFPHEVTPPGPDEKPAQYDTVAQLGNQLFGLLEIPDAQFIPISCVESVDSTPECTGLL